MIDIDEPTLMLAASVVTIVVTVVFATTTVTRHPDRASRWWAAAFVAASTLTILALVWGTDDAVPLAVSAAFSAVVTLTIGGIWIGITALADDGSRALEITATAIAVALGGWVLVALGADRRLGVCIASTLIAGLAVAAAVSLARGPMRGSINSHLLQLALGLTAGGAAVRSVSFAVSGEKAAPDEATVAWFTLLVTISAISLTALRIERLGTWWAVSDRLEERAHHGLITETAFRRALADRLERSALVGDTPAVVLVTIDDLSEINEAYGRAAGDSAMSHVSRVLRSRLPSSALLGHLGGNRLVACLTVSARRPTAVVEEALRTALLEAELPPGLPVRLRCAIRSVDGDAVLDADDLLSLLTKS